MSLNVDKLAAIEASLKCFECFDDRAKKIISAFNSPQLRPKQAQKVVEIVAKQFGEKGATWILDQLTPVFISAAWYRDDELFPEEQIEVIKTLANINLKISLSAIKKLKFYDQGDTPDLRVCHRDLGDRQIIVKWTDNYTMAPIEILGEKYGRDGALAALQLARNHIQISSAAEKIVEYFKNKFNCEPGKITYKRRFSDFFAGED